MTIKPDMPQQLQIRLTSSVELMRASLDAYLPWIEQTLGVPFAQTLPLEVDSNPGDVVAARLLTGLPPASGLRARKRAWDNLIDEWALPSGVSPRIALSLQRERQPKAAPLTVWDMDWQDCPVAFRFKGLKRPVISVKVPVVFPPTDVPIISHLGSEHWLIAHREDAAKLLLLVKQVQEKVERHLETLIILEDLDRAFPTEGKRTQERSISFQTLLNCLDGVGTQDGVIVVATANNPTCLDPTILKRPGRFDRVVQFRNPDASLRREYYQRLNSILRGEQFESAIQKTKGFSFAQLRETYILGAQSAFEHGREVTEIGRASCRERV